MRRHERPLKRVNPSGHVVWVARYTGRDGKRRSAGTFELRGACKSPAPDGRCCAQHAIDAAYERDDQGPVDGGTVGAYFETWTERHPRSERTNKTNRGRIRQVLDVELAERPGGTKRKLRDWPMVELRRRQATDLVDHMLRVQGRAATGAQGILRALSVMLEDAIADDEAGANPFKGVRVRRSDPRVRKAPREPRVWSWEEMHAFARAAAGVRTGKDGLSLMDRWRAVYAEAMLRALADLGLRLGELLPLQRQDVKGAGRCDVRGCETVVPHVHVERTAHEGVIQGGTKEERLRRRGRPAGGRVVPLSAGLEGLLARLPARIDTSLVFPTPTGALWLERNFYRDVWEPTRKATGMQPTPHEFRHSWTSLLRAAGVDPADLADMAGHTVAVATSVYTHALGRSHEAVRKAVGE